MHDAVGAHIPAIAARISTSSVSFVHRAIGSYNPARIGHLCDPTHLWLAFIGETLTQAMRARFSAFAQGALLGVLAVVCTAIQGLIFDAERLSVDASHAKVLIEAIVENAACSHLAGLHCIGQQKSYEAVPILAQGEGKLIITHHGGI